MDRVKGHRCETALCCRYMAIEVSPAQMQESARCARLFDSGELEKWPPNVRRWQDIETIADMVIPIQYEGRHPILNRPLGDHWWLYRCRHLRDDNDCDIYERRPRMCRGYPYDGDRCDFVNHGCTFKRPEEDEHEKKERWARTLAETAQRASRTPSYEEGAYPAG